MSISNLIGPFYQVKIHPGPDINAFFKQNIGFIQILVSYGQIWHYLAFGASRTLVKTL